MKPMTVTDTRALPEQRPLIAPLSPVFSGVRRIAVLRGGGLGDLLFAVPAMQALAATYPRAEITLLGSEIARDLLSGREGAPHRISVLPGEPGMNTGLKSDEKRLHRFICEQQEKKYDLAVQVHGGGRNSNPLLLSLEACHTVGTRTPDAAPLERNLDYVYFQHEVLRALEVAGLAGAPPVALEPVLPITSSERNIGARVCSATRPVIAVHPGATDPRRRWPVQRFASVCLRLLRDGMRVLLVGGATDMDRCAEILERVTAQAARAELISNLSGKLTLSELTGVLARSDLMLGNDSGPRHLAQAVGTATVSIYWFGNMINAGPLGRARHRAHLSWTTHCPTCGRDCTQPGWSAERCEHDDSFVADVPVEPVIDDVLALIATTVGNGERS